MFSASHTLDPQGIPQTSPPLKDWATSASQTPLIALIDDNVDIVDAISEALSERNYRVVGYRDAAVALETMEHGEVPALIVLDLMMPRMDGWTFRVKQRASERLHDVPVIVMSASGSAQAQAIDADVFLRKPLSLERFCETVTQTLAAAERKRQSARNAEVERLRTLGLLAASIAHDINNPLTYISGNLDLALRDCQKLPETADLARAAKRLEKSLTSARSGTDVVTEIVSGLLMFARAEDDRELTADVTRSLEAAMRLVKPYATPRARIEYQGAELPSVVGHGGRLCQVFLNLLMNAAQAIEPGASERNRIMVCTRVDGPLVFVEITDTGHGIPAQHMERIFDDFFTTKPAGHGTGIGLSFCKRVIERAGGSITVRSAEDVGTTVVVALRIVKNP